MLYAGKQEELPCRPADIVKHSSDSDEGNPPEDKDISLASRRTAFSLVALALKWYHLTIISWAYSHFCGLCNSSTDKYVPNYKSVLL